MLKSKKFYIPPTITHGTSGFLDKHGGRSKQHRHAEIDGVAVADLLSEHGSPLFVFSETTLRSRYRDAYAAFAERYPRVQFAWSYKTNYLKAVCQVFHSEGAIAEVVSDFEYEKARSLGIPGQQVILNGPYKSEALLRRAIDEEAKIQIDNFYELSILQQLAAAANKCAKVAIRVNVETGFAPAWSKFGFSYESGDARRAAGRVIEADNLTLAGLHMHIGTFVLEPAQYEAALQNLLELGKDIEGEHAIRLEYINAGGGFPSSNTLHHQYLPGEEASPSFEDYADAICGTLTKFYPDESQQPLLYLESGRALVDDAGYLLTTVIDARRTGDGQRAVTVDAGVNVLYTAAWYKFNIHPAQPTGGQASPTKVYGPLCMNIDVIRESAPLPNLSPGDQLVVHPVGAYNVTQSMQFIAYRPAIVMIGSDQSIDLIRAKENLEYVESLERLPARLSDSSGE